MMMNATAILAPPIVQAPVARTTTQDPSANTTPVKLTTLGKAKVTPSPPKDNHTEPSDPDIDPWLLDQGPVNSNPNPWITKVRKKRLHVDVENNEESDPRVKESTHEAIKKRGEGLTEEASSKLTPVKVEFKLTKTATQFNARTALGKLLEQIKQVDRHAIIQSTKDDTQWNTAEDLPVGDVLSDHIVIRHENVPTQGNIVSVYTKIRSSKTIGEIKFNQEMYHYLSINKIYIRPDRYKTERTRSPGFFIKLHPRLIYKDNFKNKLDKALATLELDKDNEVIAKYLRGSGNSNEVPTLPAYHLHSTKRKFGPVTAEVLTVTCPEHAATYLKTLLCKLSEKRGLPLGIFIPTGTQQILGPATMVTLLRQHNLFISTTTMIALEGIDEEVMWESSLDITQSTKGTLEKKIRHDNPGIISIEKTNSTEVTGKWFVVISKKDESGFQRYIDDKLPGIFQQIKVNDMNLNLKPPRRAGATRSTEVVGTYASVLKGLALPLATNSEKKYDAPNLRPRKRPTVAVSNTKEAHMETYKEAWPTTSKETNPDIMSNITDTEKRIEEKFNKQLAAMKLQIDSMSRGPDKAQTEAQGTLEEKFNKLQQEMEKRLEAKMKQISDTIESQVTRQITQSIEALTQSIEKRLESSMESIIHSVSVQIDRSLTQRLPNLSSMNSSSPLTQPLRVSEQCALSPGSDVEMIGARDP